MMTHTYHPDVAREGLADGCPRCEELAEEPWRSLDDEALLALIEAIQMRQRPRSANEARAMNRLQELAKAAARVGFERLSSLR